jgi:hypothetical protein
LFSARHLRRTAFVAVQVSNLYVTGDCFVGKSTLLATTLVFILVDMETRADHAGRVEIFLY